MTGKIYEASPGGGIDWSPPDTAAEVVQNVRTVLSVVKGTAPLDRGFGISRTVIDQPGGRAEALLSAEIAEAVRKCEKRAEVKAVRFVQDGEGSCTARVFIEVKA